MSHTATSSKPAATSISRSGIAYASPGGTAHPVPTSATGRNEFTYTREFGRGCWVIRRHGLIYGEIERNSANPGHTETYVRRIVATLNGENR